MSLSLIKYPVGNGSSGQVNPGLENQIAYYAADGTVLSGITINPNEVVATNINGLPVGSGISLTDLMTFQTTLRLKSILNNM